MDGFDGFEAQHHRVNGVDIFARVGGTVGAPPLLLLHGFPQSHVLWRRVAVQLQAHFRLVLPDLRGYGDSAKPPGATDHSNYSKRTIAADVHALMQSLGHTRYFVCGHDRGGRVAHRLALDQPGAVQKLGVIDIAPTLDMYAATDMRFATAYYHWFHLIQPSPLPERMIGADPRFYLHTKLAGWGSRGNSFMEAAALAECGNFTNLLWAMPGVALSGPEATGAWMNEFGARHFDLTRTWDFRFPHPGAPEPNGDSYLDWDATGGYLLALAMPLKKLLLTGKKPNIAPQIDATTANALIADGRGWSNNDRYSAYDKIDPDTLLEKLGSWSPTVRERASIAISRHKGDKPIAAVVDLLDSPNLFARYGACEVIILLKAAAAPAVPKLTALLNHEDLWMRIKAAEALSHIGAPAMPSLPILLNRLAQEPTKSDPRGMEQRYLCFSVFETMLKNSLDGVDRALLNKAVAAGLRNQDGRARSTISSVYKMLSYQEIEPILPAILDAAAKPAPSGEMFADGIRLAGLELLAAHHVAEGIPACTYYLLNQNWWASQIRTPEILKILVSYGVQAKSAIPQLKQAAEMFDKDPSDFPKHMSVQKAADVRKAIADIEASTINPELRSIR